MKPRCVAHLVAAGLLTLGAPGPADASPGGRGNAVMDRAPAALPGPPVPLVLLRRSAKRAPDGSGLDVLVAANPAIDAIAARVARTMSDPIGFGQFVLRLDRDVKTSRARDAALPASQRAALSAPAYLFFSDREGGFPAESFWLEQPDGSLGAMRDVPFVDMVVNERDLVPGRIDGLAEIYAHELGHLMMTALAGPPSRRASSAIHFITVRTDGWYAFSEGWGEHFQPLGLDHAGRARGSSRDEGPSATESLWYGRFAREQIEGCWICPANLRFLSWHGRGEQRLRDAPLRANHFVHGTDLPPGLRGDERPPFDVRMYRDVIPPLPGGRLKNGAQMLSSEGVVGTLFYRLVTDERLRNTYRDPAFYRPFLPDDRAADLMTLGPRAIVAPAENVYLKIFDVLHRRFTWGSWPAMELVAGYATHFPDEAAAVYDVFLDVTRGVTVETAAFIRHVEPGYLAGLRDRLVAGTARLDGNLGRPLWMLVPTFTVGMGLFRYFPVPTPFTFDLNAADIADLRSVAGVFAPLAESILRARDERGSFASVGDLSTVPGMTPGVLSLFNAMAARMEERLDRSQPRRADSGWLKDYLALMLRATYDIAAAWQFGRALLLAAVGYLGVLWVIGRLARRDLHASPRGPHRAWWRRGGRAIGRGMALAAIPCTTSVALYALGVLPTPLNMAGVGLALGLAAWALRLARHRAAAVDRPSLLATTSAWIVAAAIIGAMY